MWFSHPMAMFGSISRMGMLVRVTEGCSGAAAFMSGCLLHCACGNLHLATLIQAGSTATTLNLFTSPLNIPIPIASHCSAWYLPSEVWKSLRRQWSRLSHCNSDRVLFRPFSRHLPGTSSEDAFPRLLTGIFACIAIASLLAVCSWQDSINLLAIAHKNPASMQH